MSSIWTGQSLEANNDEEC